VFVSLLFVWFRVIDHLRVEWTVNESYNYGWAVPFLCALLLYRRLSHPNPNPPRNRNPNPDPSRDPRLRLLQRAASILLAARFRIPNLASRPPQPSTPPSTLNHPEFGVWDLVFLRPWSRGFIISCLVVLFVITRWIAVANPDWRLMSWALSLEAIALTLLLFFFAFRSLPSPLSPLTSKPSVVPWSHGPVVVWSRLAFPICFFLVAVPWPTQIEHTTVQWLTRGIVAATAEVLNGLGLVAIRHGNVIETAGGLVDVDRACSGIRSLQSSLMLALFFGEWYRLRALPRVALCGFAILVACFFNLARTLALSLVATHQGSAAVARWHDPAGVVILLGCFTTVWAFAYFLRRRSGADVPSALVRQASPPAAPVTSAFQPAGSDTFECRSPSAAPLNPSSGVPVPRVVPLSRCLVVSFCILLAGEVAIALWYRVPNQAEIVQWRAAMPRDNASFKTMELPPAAVQILRCSTSESGAWQGPDGTSWQMIYLRWESGRASVQLARGHTPEICIPAAGRNLRSIREIEPIAVGDITLPFRAFETAVGSRPLFVFYTLWEDGLAVQHTQSASLTRQARWQAVMQRRKNPGQRVIQIAISGARDHRHAEQLLRAHLPRLIHRTAPTPP